MGKTIVGGMTFCAKRGAICQVSAICLVIIKWTPSQQKIASASGIAWFPIVFFDSTPHLVGQMRGLALGLMAAIGKHNLSFCLSALAAS
jgi:hypothetical protein